MPKGKLNRLEYIFCMGISHASNEDCAVIHQAQVRVLSIVTLSFKEDNKWRLSDGTAVFNVKISDGTFLQKVNEGASFAKGEMLRVSMVTRVSYTKEGLKTEYEVVRVLEHLTIPRQLWLV